MILGAGISAILAKSLSLEASDFTRMVLIGSISSLLPDADLIFMPLSKMMHRGPGTHSLGASIGIGLTMVAFVWLLGESGIIEAELGIFVTAFIIGFTGAFSHTVTDSMTQSGTLMLWPLSMRKFQGEIKSRDLGINIILVILGIFLLLYSVGVVG